MLKVLINEEEVLTNKDFTIKKEMLNTPSVILNNVYPKSWEDEKDYTSNFYHPQDYSKCKIIDETIVPAEPGETITGTSFTIEDNDSTKLNELTEIEGNTTQAGTPTPNSPQPINVVSGRQELSVVGKNLFTTGTGTSTRVGVEATYNGSEIILNGTTTGAGNVFYDSSISLNTGYRKSQRLAAGTYTLTVNVDKAITFPSGTGMAFYLRDRNTNVILSFSSLNRSYQFTLTEDKDVYSQLYCNAAGIIFDNVTFKIQIEKGSTASEYEEFKGQSYEINLGKNLLDIKDGSYSYLTTNTWEVQDHIVSLSVNDITYQGGMLQLVKGATGRWASPTDNHITNGGTYTLSVSVNGTITRGTNGFITFYCYIYKSDGTTRNEQLIINNNNTYFTKTFTIANDEHLGEITMYSQFVECENVEFKIMLEKGSTASSFSPYKTPIELCKIGNYKDRIFKGSGVNLFDKDNVENNKVINGSGQIVDATGYIVGDFIEVKPNTQYTISFTSTNTELLRIGYYKNDKTYIERPTSANNPWTITTPSNCYYIRVCTPSVYQNVMLNEGSTALPYEPYNSKGKWYLHKEIGKVVLNGSELWQGSNNYFFSTAIDNLALWNGYQNYSNYFKSYNAKMTPSTVVSEDSLSVGGSNATDGLKTRIKLVSLSISTANDFKTWLSTHNTIVYYVLKTPTTTEITDTELISQLNAIELLEGLNNVSVSSADLPGEITIHYNYTEEQTIDDLLFCGVVKNSGNISLNPRQPHFQSLQILDFKTFLSEGELDSFVIYQKTILEAIQMVIANIQDYGFILGNVNILNPTDVIGAYSTKDKTAYDVFNYIADITQSRWTTRLIDENHVAIDFYDPTLMTEGTPINYTQTFFENNLIDDMTYSYGSNNYRNKQVMTSSQVYSNISQQQSIVANGYQTQFPTEQPIGKINSITSNGIPLTFATFNEKEMGYVADFYYSPGDNYFESEDLRTTGEILIIDYVAIVEGRQIITNPLEIDRINDSTGRKGIISRYEQRNDATTSTELQKIGESYIKYKGTPEIKLKISTRKNIWEVGQRVQFNAPIEDLDTEYMVRTKKINYISTIDTIFYEYELISSFNSETEINYFDNQRAKASGNIGEGEYISRNIDIESTANIIFYDTETTEVQVDGDNELNSILNSPFIS